MRFAAVVEYNGAYFHGFQKQTHHLEITIQAALEAAIAQVANHPVSIQCAGRTDKGVHATRQIIHFDSNSVRKPYGWMMGINTHLPVGVSVVWLEQVNDDFHARHKAIARQYRYFIYNYPCKPALMHDQLTWWKPNLDYKKMHEAAQSLLGEHDFSAFRASDCQANTPVKTLHHIQVVSSGNIIMLEVKANAFLYHMVRNIAGVLLLIGEKRKPVDWCAQVLQSKNRQHLGVTAPAAGLYLVGVDYEQGVDIPSQAFGPAIFETRLGL